MLTAMSDDEYIARLEDELSGAQREIAARTAQEAALAATLNDTLDKLKEARRERDEYRELRDRARDEAFRLRELLAVMNGDGGQHQMNAGTSKAVEDALAKWYATRQRVPKADDLREVCDAAEAWFNLYFPISRHELALLARVRATLTEGPILAM